MMYEIIWKCLFWFLYDYETFVHLFSDIFYLWEFFVILLMLFTDFMDATSYFAEDVMFFFPTLFWCFFFFLSCLVSFKFLCVCFSLCLLSKKFGDSWVSVYLIVGLSKSSWKPCVCFLWVFLHSNLARVFHWRVPSYWYSNTIFHRDEFSTVPVWGSIGLFVNTEVSSLVR